jgi:hypothetical protein
VKPTGPPLRKPDRNHEERPVTTEQWLDEERAKADAERARQAPDFERIEAEKAAWRARDGAPPPTPVTADIRWSDVPPPRKSSAELAEVIWIRNEAARAQAMRAIGVEYIPQPFATP